jgi:hypothetical protein
MVRLDDAFLIAKLDDTRATRVVQDKVGCGITGRAARVVQDEVGCGITGRAARVVQDEVGCGITGSAVCTASELCATLSSCQVLFCSHGTRLVISSRDRHVVVTGGQHTRIGTGPTRICLFDLSVTLACPECLTASQSAPNSSYGPYGHITSMGNA